MSAPDPRATQQARLTALFRAEQVARRRAHQGEIDQHLRSWRGVDFGLLALDLREPEDLLRARARMLGLNAGELA